MEVQQLFGDYAWPRRFGFKPSDHYYVLQTISLFTGQKRLFALNLNIETAVNDSQGSVQVMELLLNTRGEWNRAPSGGEL